MKSLNYYSFDGRAADGINTNSRESAELPVMVNISGTINIRYSFTTHNTVGRLDYYLMYITEGKLQVDMNGVEHTVGAGDFFIFPPKYKYRYTLTSGVICYYYVHFTGSDVEKILHALGILPLTVYNAGHSEEVAERFSALFSEHSLNDDVRDVALGASLQQILIALFRASSGEKSRSPLARSIAHIKAFYTDPLRIPELAAMDGLSVSRYNAVFRELTGTSPMKYITNLRMCHACSLLSSTDLPIGNIGEMVGYYDNHFFSKIFKSYIGVSPQKYREQK